ncbi:MAG: MFS transporter [Oscillospiraceae bacterium]|nr:MFS transporter [Oscillospiraceae bacterium]
MSEKVSLKQKITTGIATLKKHWKTPPDGYYVNYREFLNLSLGSGSLSFLSVIISWTTIAINIPMMISYFKVSTGFIFVAGIVASIFGLVRAPILSMMIDNSNSKKGKFKPFLLWSAILTALSFTFIPFIPQAWVGNILFAFDIPAIPIFAVAASHIEVSLASLIMFLLVQIGTFFNTLLSQCLTGIEQTVSPVSQERANIGAFKGLICNIPSSVVNIIIPLVAGIAFASSKDPMNNIELYRWAFPICSIGGVAFVFFTYFGVEERVVVHKEYVAKVKFSEGAKQLFSNKYFWIITIFNIAVGIRANINMYLWICNYGIGGQKGAFALTVCNMVLNNALVPGMLVGPWMIKKLGKRRVMIISTVGFTIMAFMQLLTLKSPYLMLVAIFFQNLFNGLSYISNIMVSDVLDYQQWKTGKRLEGFWQNCLSFVMTFCGLFTSALMPLFMSFGGVGFGDNIDTALKNTDIMYGTFRSVTWLGIIGSVLCAIPILFYDLSESKHANYIRALRIRAIVENYKNKELSAEDIKKFREIVDYANENNDDFVLDELSRHNETELILKETVPVQE